MFADFLYNGSGIWCGLGRLKDSGATGCDCANEGADGQLDGEVVGAFVVISSRESVGRLLRANIPDD